tara:strand:+ start:1316 stop:1606 length:291 start_codon:yes stop_codon:yes gene_type:complete
LNETIKLDSRQTLTILESYLKAGARLHHFNGAQWYIACSDDLVAIIDSGRRDDCTLDFFTEEKAVSYLKSGSNCREDNAFENAFESYKELIVGVCI